MTDSVDLDAYGEPNDLPPGEPGPRAPRDQPDGVNEQFKVWLFDAEDSATVPDAYVVDQHPEPLDFRMWVFAGRGDRSHFVMRSSHLYGPDDGPPDGGECCEVLLEDKSLTSDHCPAAVTDLVEDLTAADVVMPDDSHGGPISY